MAKSRYALREPGYFRVRIMNRFDRIQVLFDTIVERVCGRNMPGTDGPERGR